MRRLKFSILLCLSIGICWAYLASAKPRFHFRISPGSIRNTVPRIPPPAYQSRFGSHGVQPPWLQGPPRLTHQDLPRLTPESPLRPQVSTTGGSGRPQTPSLPPPSKNIIVHSAIPPAPETIPRPSPEASKNLITHSAIPPPGESIAVPPFVPSKGLITHSAIPPAQITIPRPSPVPHKPTPAPKSSIGHPSIKSTAIPLPSLPKVVGWEASLPQAINLPQTPTKSPLSELVPPSSAVPFPSKIASGTLTEPSKTMPQLSATGIQPSPQIPSMPSGKTSISNTIPKPSDPQPLIQLTKSNVSTVSPAKAPHLIKPAQTSRDKPKRTRPSRKPTSIISLHVLVNGFNHTSNSKLQHVKFPKGEE